MCGGETIVISQFIPNISRCSSTTPCIRYGCGTTGVGGHVPSRSQITIKPPLSRVSVSLDSNQWFTFIAFQCFSTPTFAQVLFLNRSEMVLIYLVDFHHQNQWDI